MYCRFRIKSVLSSNKEARCLNRDVASCEREGEATTLVLFVLGEKEVEARLILIT